jgi:tRNA (cmo5U34)-methyltransferase
MMRLRFPKSGDCCNFSKCRNVGGETMKATADELREKFDADVDRFSDLERGHQAAMDSPLAMELIASAALAVTPGARRALDVGCGGGNYALKLLQKFPGPDLTLLDLSKTMLEGQNSGPAPPGPA